MIPRKLHHVWLGPRPVPQEWASRWAELHPGWEHRVWREQDLAQLEMANRELFDAYLERQCWHGASDIARVAILEAEGGVYVDIDSQPLRTLEGAPFMAGRFFAGYEPIPSIPGRVANGTIGSEPGHPILRTYARLVAEMDDTSEPWNSVGGNGLTAAVLVHAACCRPQVLPARTFYATDAAGRPTPGREQPYIRHLWATTTSRYPARAVVLVPRRAGDPHRDAAWEYVRRSWAAHGWPIYVGEHNDGPFNAAAARNLAAAAADADQRWEVAVFVDADTVMLDPGPVLEAVRMAAGKRLLVRPYARYWQLDEAGSAQLMAGATRRPAGHLLRETAHGGVNVVSRELWDAVGGYDERFRGWGSEDTAFELACVALGGLRRLRGEVFHLWHPISADRNTSHPGYLANVALRGRYEAARRPAAMRELLAERDGTEVARPPAIAAPAQPEGPARLGAVIMTNGRREYIEATVASLEEQVGPFDERIICDDSGEAAYAEWLRATFPAWEVRAHRHLGHAGAVRFALAAAAGMRSEWVWWSEDDLIYRRRVDVQAMAQVFAENPDLKQMALRRQAWFPAEVEAGGMIERFDPGLFTERAEPHPWIEHRQFYTLQPHLVRRELVAVLARQWPNVPNSEHQFGLRLFRNPLPICGLWGSKADEPWTEHVGLERTGTGY